MLSLLKPHIANGGVIYNKTTAQQIEIFNSYFNAFKEVFSDAWNDQKNFVLTKSMGFEIMTGVFRDIKQRCDLYEGRQSNKNSFTNQITFLRDKNVTLKLKDNSKIEIPLNWSSKSMGNFSSKQWIREIVKEIINLLNV